MCFVYRFALKKWFHLSIFSTVKTATSSVKPAGRVTTDFRLLINVLSLCRSGLDPCICPKCRGPIIGRATDIENYLRFVLISKSSQSINILTFKLAQQRNTIIIWLDQSYHHVLMLVSPGRSRPLPVSQKHQRTCPMKRLLKMNKYSFRLPTLSLEMLWYHVLDIRGLPFVKQAPHLWSLQEEKPQTFDHYYFTFQVQIGSMHMTRCMVI